MKKNVFDVFKQMNEIDIKESTRNLSISKALVRVDKVTQGTKITMGVDDQSLHEIMNEKSVPILLLVNVDLYNKLMNEIPEDKVEKIASMQHYIWSQSMKDLLKRTGEIKDQNDGEYYGQEIDRDDVTKYKNKASTKYENLSKQEKQYYRIQAMKLIYSVDSI